MDLKEVLASCGAGDWPAGLGGCHRTDRHFDSCGFDVVVFDGGAGIHTVWDGNSHAVIRHADRSESSVRSLLAYDGIRIIRDDQWELAPLLAGIREKRRALYLDHARNRLIEAIFHCQRTFEAVKISDVFAACWQKCASYCLADALCSLNFQSAGPSHMLEILREIPSKPAGEHVLTVMETVGTERATPTLLGRMLASTVGFSRMSLHCDPKAIRQKYDHFLENSMPADCYFYLGCLNWDNLESRRRGELDRNLHHILRVAFDLDSNPSLLERNAARIRDACTDVLEGM